MFIVVTWSVNDKFYLLCKHYYYILHTINVYCLLFNMYNYALNFTKVFDFHTEQAVRIVTMCPDVITMYCKMAALGRAL